MGDPCCSYTGTAKSVILPPGVTFASYPTSHPGFASSTNPKAIKAGDFCKTSTGSISSAGSAGSAAGAGGGIHGAIHSPGAAGDAAADSMMLAAAAAAAAPAPQEASSPMDAEAASFFNPGEVMKSFTVVTNVTLPPTLNAFYMLELDMPVGTYQLVGFRVKVDKRDNLHHFGMCERHHTTPITRSIRSRRWLLRHGASSALCCAWALMP